MKFFAEVEYLNGEKKGTRFLTIDAESESKAREMAKTPTMSERILDVRVSANVANNFT